MKLICEYCHREYEWNENIPNYGKRGRIVKSNRYCCYECGKKAVNEKIKNHFHVKYGVDNISQLETIKQRKKETIYKHYGEDGLKAQEIREKTKQTNLKKYGTEYYCQTQEFKEKSKQTCLEKYGTENAFSSEIIKNKIKQTNLKKYGVEHNMKHPDLLKKNMNARKFNISSKIELDWLNYLNVFNRQVIIAGFMVDGYDKSTNTIYEFLGDYWHGNPNPLTNKGKIFTEKNNSFKKTFNRFKLLKEAGYNVIYCWEFDWVNKNSLFYKRVFEKTLEY